MKTKTLLLIIAILLMASCATEEENAFNRSENFSMSAPIVISEKSGAGFGIEEVGYDEIGENPREWFRKVKKRGISIVSFDPFDMEEALTVIDSKTIKKMGFEVDEEYPPIEKVFEDAKKENMYLIVMIESLAHAKEGFLGPSRKINKKEITPENVGNFIRELGEIAKKEGIEIAISEEAFDDEFIPEIAKASREAGIKYIHFFEDFDCAADEVLSEDYGYYFKDLRNSEEDREQAGKNLEIGSYFGELGFLNIMYGRARACGKEAGTLTAGSWGLGATTHQNIALLRSIEFGPKKFFFVVGEDEEGNSLEGEREYVENYNFSKLDSLIYRFSERGKKPVADFIIERPEGDIVDYFDLALLGSASAITNSILGSGFELKVTKKPVNADLYYVFSPASINGKDIDLSKESLELFYSGKPVFYQAAGEIKKDMPNWATLMKGLGVEGHSSLVAGKEEVIPLKAEGGFPEGRFGMNYAGYTLEVENPEELGTYVEGHVIHLIKAPEEEVLLRGNDVPLIIRKDNAYFVNGNYLHFGVSPFLTNLMAEKSVYNKPSFVYLAEGKTSAVFTAYDSYIDINFPSAKSIAEFDEKGDEIKTGLEAEGNRVKGKLKKFHLAVMS